jgi:predicted RNA-binding Zn-ribbon protein involved in translation (DUF1610 family)
VGYFVNEFEEKELTEKALLFNDAFINLMQCVNRLFFKNDAKKGVKITSKITSGYEGNCCPQCGMFMLVRTGTCYTCRSCGWNGGCG